MPTQLKNQQHLWGGSRPMYNSLCADMVMYQLKITLHKMHDSELELEVCPLSKDH